MQGTRLAGRVASAKKKGDHSCEVLAFPGYGTPVAADHHRLVPGPGLEGHGALVAWSPARGDS